MSAAPRLRYARQYTLAEIGTTGQARLEAASLRAGAGDPRATEVALAYLARAGVRIAADGATLETASSAEVARVAGRAEQREAAAFLAGSLAAVRAIAEIAHAPARPLSPTQIPALMAASGDVRA